MKKPFPWPVKEMRQWYEDERLTLQEIADRLSGDAWQDYWRKHLGQEYRPNQKIVNKVATRAGFQMRKTGAPLHRNGSWKGGRTITKDGYVHVRIAPKRYALEHRLVMEHHLGRPLQSHEVVHHRNGNKQDNRIENLQLFASQSDHIAHCHRHNDSSRISAAHLARKRQYPVNLTLLRKWHIDDKLSTGQIAALIDRNANSVRDYLQAGGFLQRHQKPGKLLPRHRYEADRFLSSSRSVEEPDAQA